MISQTKARDALLSEYKVPRRNIPKMVWATIILLFLGMLLLSQLTPMVSDDFAYCFSWADWTRVHSVTQIFPSMAVHRNVTNGRVFVHGLVQLLLLFPRMLFSIINTLNAVLLFSLVRRATRLECWQKCLPVLVFCMFYFWCFIPAFGENCLWLDGSVNYFWGGVYSLLFLLPYIELYCGNSGIRHPIRTILYFPLSFLIGTWSENASLVFLFLAACLLLLSWKKTGHFSLMPAFWILAGAMGYLYLMTAPATAGRAGASDLSVLGYNFRAIFHAMETWLLWPLIILALLFGCSISLRVQKERLVLASLFAAASLLSLFSYLFAAYFVTRHLFFAVFFLMLATAILLAGLAEQSRMIIPISLLAVLSVLFLLRFPTGVLDIAISYHKQQLRENQISEAFAAGQDSIVLENYYPYTGYAVAFELDPCNPEVGPNVNIADYYGLSSVLGQDPIPES